MSRPRLSRAQQPDRAPRPASDVLANRLAAALVHHEPGWRLPRHTALARRYNVSPAEIESAVAELVSRHLIRRLADGQLYRASPAEYLIELEGVSGLVLDAGPDGRRPDLPQPPGVVAAGARGHRLGAGPGELRRRLRGPVPVDRGRRARGLLDDLPARGELARTPARHCRTRSACCRTPAGSAGPAACGSARGAASPAPAALPRALHIEMQPPPPAVARSLRLPAGQPATIVTVRFDDPATAPGRSR